MWEQHDISLGALCTEVNRNMEATDVSVRNFIFALLHSGSMEMVGANDGRRRRRRRRTQHILQLWLSEERFLLLHCSCFTVWWPGRSLQQRYPAEDGFCSRLHSEILRICCKKAAFTLNWESRADARWRQRLCGICVSSFLKSIGSLDPQLAGGPRPWPRCLPTSPWFHSLHT